jgi:hypothetical protein
LITGTAAIVPVIALAIAALLLTPPPPKPCRLGCTTSPYPIKRSLARPLINPNRYVSAAFGYTVDYVDPNGTPSEMDTTSVEWDLSATGYSIRFEGVPATGRGAQDIVEVLHQSKFPDFRLVYPIPGAETGYWPGYGGVYDATVTPANGQSTHTRLIIVVAVEKGLAIEMTVEGPFVADNGDGQPLPSQIDPRIAQFSDETLNTVTWKGDVPL